MEIILTDEAGYALAVCSGPLDASIHRPFRDRLHPLFAAAGVNLIVDLSGSSWINSEGVAALVRLVSDANTRGCRVVYVGPSTFVREVFKVTRLDRFFDLAETREAAVLLLAGETASTDD